MNAHDKSADPRAGTSGDRAAAEPPPARRWPSYHFYVVLALFDVAVIVASIVVQHQTLGSFDNALTDITLIHERHRWLTELGEGLVRLNAPGNDVFASKDPQRERRRFVEARIGLQSLLDAPPPNTPAPANYSEHVDRMIFNAERIFDAFDRIVQPQAGPVEERQLMDDATKLMPAMDHAQAEALGALTGDDLRLLDEQRAALDRHQRVLAGRTRIEFIFVLIVAVILGGVTWYWRQLQQMHDQFLAEHERAETERRNRLASVGEVCFSVAHGIRNPVAAIAGSAQLTLEYGQLDERSRERLKDVVASCRSLTERVSKLLSFARDGHARRQEITVGDILDQALAEVAGKLEAQSITVQRQFEAGGATIQADRNVLVQAVIELLSNAMDQLPDGGRITMVCAQDPRRPNTVEFGVMDTGPGFAEDVKARACELFFTRKEGGSGIGLASVRRAAELHDGEVVIRDAQPRGADVRIRMTIQ